MSNLVQLVYISRALFPPSNNKSMVEPEVARILATARTKNKKVGLVGALYYGNSCFFQCLEGDEHEVDKLYEALHHDTRHDNLKLLSRRQIDQLSYSKWTMKYVSVDGEVKALLASKGHKTFDPYSFDEDLVQSMLNLLQSSIET